MLGLLFGAGRADASPGSVPTCVLVALPHEEHAGRPATGSPPRCAAAASPTEVAPTRGQVRQADPVRRAARHPVRLVPRRRRRADEVKDIRSGEQEPADPATWQPPAADLHPTIASA